MSNETRLTRLHVIRPSPVEAGRFRLARGVTNIDTGTLDDVGALGLALVAFADAQPTGPLHVVDQSGQPYGSVRRCCNRCGAMVERTTRYVETLDEWTRSDGRCSP